MKDEEWKLITWIPDIPNDKYSVSTYGRIRNNYTGKIRTNSQRKNGTIVCIVSNSTIDSMKHKRLVHYQMIGDSGIKKPYKTVQLTVSTQVAKAFLPPPQNVDGTMIAYIGYKDDDITNVHVDNLEWRYRLTYDYKESLKRKVNRKLSDTTVRKICKLLLEENGNLKHIRRRIVEEMPDVTIEQIMSIKYKEHYQSISDEYFEYYDRKFIPLK